MKNDFKRDLECGQIAEYKLQIILDNKGYTTTSTAAKGKFSGYDITATRKGFTQTIEVKYDRKANTTGNVAIELFTNTIKGEKKRSGLSASTADWYAYTFGDYQNYYLINTSKLKELCKTCNDIRRGGDNNRISLAIFKKELFIKNCKLVSAIPPPNCLPL